MGEKRVEGTIDRSNDRSIDRPGYPEITQKAKGLIKWEIMDAFSQLFWGTLEYVIATKVQRLYLELPIWSRISTNKKAKTILDFAPFTTCECKVKDILLISNHWQVRYVCWIWSENRVISYARISAIDQRPDAHSSLLKEGKARSNYSYPNPTYKYMLHTQEYVHSCLRTSGSFALAHTN